MGEQAKINEIYETSAHNARILMEMLVKANLSQIWVEYDTKTMFDKPLKRTLCFSAGQYRTNVGYYDMVTIERHGEQSGNLLESDPYADHYIHGDFSARSIAANLEDVELFLLATPAIHKAIQEKLEKVASLALSVGRLEAQG